MYKRILPAVFSFMLLSGMSEAQNINFEKVNFEYVRLPLQPFSKELKTYSGNVVLSYQEEVEAEKAAREQEVADIKAKAAADQEEYKKKSLGEKAFNKIVLEEGKPKGPFIGKEPYMPKIHDTNVLSSSYIQIPGYTRQDENADVVVTVMLNGFAMTDMSEKTKESKVKINGVETSSMKYFYQVSYKHPISVRVQDKSGRILDEFPVEALNEAITSNTGEFKSKDALEKYWSTSQNNFLLGLDESIISRNMNIVKDELASRYGFTVMPRATAVVNIKHKKVSYDDFNQAFEKATTAYSMLASQEKQAEAVAELEKALEIWNNALKESDLKDKKARIDAKVTAATHLNCAEAYMWLNNFEEAEKHINKIKVLDINKYESMANELNAIILEQKSRYNNNKM